MWTVVLVVLNNACKVACQILKETGYVQLVIN